MIPLPLVRSLPSSRFLLPSFVAIAIGVLTSWATLTGYTAKKPENRASPSNGAGSATRNRETSDRATIDKNYGNLPLSFEANRGQTGAGAKYVARGPGYNIFLTQTEAVLVFSNRKKSSPEGLAEPQIFDESPGAAARGPRLRASERDQDENAKENKPTVLRMRLEGANTGARVEGFDELPGKVNYFLGNDSSKWLTDVPTFGKIAYRNAYPGVDVVYYGNRQQLEYDLVVAPNADPNVIQIRFEGAESMRVDKQGNLILKTSAGEIRQGKPSIFQEVDGTKKQVAGGYVVKQGNKVGFTVSRYDRRKPLLIDPILSYLSFVNTRGRGFAIAVDPSGNAYITGSIDDGDQLPATPGSYQIAGGGNQDVFVTKINQAGKSALYSTYLGGNGDEDAYGIAIDSSGNAYITGYASGTFPTTAGAYHTARASTYDAFVTKLNPSGSGLVYSTFFGGNNYEEGDSVVVDAAGNTIVTGVTESINLPTTAGAVQSAIAGGSDAFLVQFNASGSAVNYLTYLGGGAYDGPGGLALDSAGNTYVVGQTFSTNFPLANTLQQPHGTDRGLFKSNNAGNTWSLSRNGLNGGSVNALAVDPTNPSVIYAGTHGGVSKTIDAGANWTTTGTTLGNVFALAIDPSNSAIVYAGSTTGAFKTTNGGGSWTPIITGLSPGAPPFDDVMIIRGLAIDRNAPTTVYAASFGGMFKSTNGGNNWVQINTGLTGLSMRAVVIDPSNSSTIYAANPNRVFKSTNGGTNWTPVITGLPATPGFRTLAIDPVTPATLYVGGTVGIYKTTNAGTNWTAANNNLLQPYTDNVSRLPLVGVLAIDPVTPTTLYAGAISSFIPTGAFPLTAVLKSTDGGASWTSFTNGFNNLNSGVPALAVNPANTAIIYAGNSGDSEGFVSKLNIASQTLVFSSYFGGSLPDYAIGVATDTSGNAYVTGNTSSANFTTTPGAFQTTLRGAVDVFVAKLGTNNGLIYSTYLGGGKTEDSLGVAADASGNAYVTGRTDSTDFPVTAGSFQTKIGNPGDTTKSDAFITKLNPAGSAPSYSSYLGGAGDEARSPFNLFLFNAVGLDALGNAYVVGITSDPSTFPAFEYVNVNNALGTTATYVAKINANISSYSITGRLTTSTNTPLVGVFVEASNVQGFFRSTNTDSQGYYSLFSLPAGDYTVTPNKYDSQGRHYLFAPPTRTFTGLNSDQTANFTGTQVYDIQGFINSQTIPSLGIFDVTVTLSGSASASTVTDANGNFVFRNLVTGNYTVTPSKAGFTFSPVNRVFTNLSADQSTGFATASGSFFTVSGRAADASNAAISNATISMLLTPLSGLRTQSVQTDANGNYSIPNLQGGGNYTFLATKPLLTFIPLSQTFNNLSGNQTLNFTASPATGLIGRIAFRSNFSDVSVMNADGSGETVLATASDQCSGDSGPAWSPDGARIAFNKCDPNAQGENIFLMNADGSGVTRLTSEPHLELFPRWAPDGTRLTFSFGECSGTDVLVPEIFAVDTGGAIRSQLTNNNVVDAASDWSPNGSTIVFARGNNGSCSSTDTDASLYVMDSVGGNERRLTSNPTGDFGPAHSPDGSKIAFERKSLDSAHNISITNIFVMNADGTGQTKITPDAVEALRPSWSPDGTKIAFSGRTFAFQGANQIFVVDSDGSGLAQITSGVIPRESPSWQHYSISGRVTGNTTGVPITMTLAGTLTRVTRTDAAGNYVFGNLAPGGNYSVTPISTAFGFNPAKTDVNNLAGNQVANFAVLPAVIPAPTPPLADDFAAAQRDPEKWNLGTQTQPLGAFDPQIPVVQQNGQLVVTPRSQTSGLHYNGYVAVNSFDFNNSKATVEVAQPATNGAETIFAIGSDLDNFSRFLVRAGSGVPAARKGRQPVDVGVPQLIFQVRVGGQLTSLSLPYDPVAHRFMRFRHEAPTNSIVFETSPDNVDFIVRHQVVLQKSVSALTAELSAGTSTATDPGHAVFDNFSLVTNTFQFSVTGFTVNESAGKAVVTVTRSGDLSTPASVDYSTFDETARQRNRYIPAVGTLSFAPGISTKTFGVLVEDNSLVEGSQTVSLRLLDSSGAGLNSPGRAVLTVDDNDSPPITTNPLDGAQFFVRQNYFDFLSRSPDQGGLDYWSGQITQCGSDQACINLKRIDVSNAFYFELEFQQTGSYVYRLYRVAYGNNQPFPNPGPDANYPGEDKKLLSYTTFISDRARVVGGSGLAQSQLNLANSIIKRPAFIATYPLNLDGPGFVDAVLSKMKADIGVDLISQRTGLIALFNSGGRGAVIYRLADDNISSNPINNRPFIDAEYNRAFVATQYFGYLRRNPDLGGFIFWLGQVNSGPLRDVNKQHAMVCSFVTSTEYQGRFSQAITHSNTECPH